MEGMTLIKFLALDSVLLLLASTICLDPSLIVLEVDPDRVFFLVSPNLLRLHSITRTQFKRVIRTSFGVVMALSEVLIETVAARVDFSVVCYHSDVVLSGGAVNNLRSVLNSEHAAWHLVKLSNVIVSLRIPCEHVISRLAREPKSVVLCQNQSAELSVDHFLEVLALVRLVDLPQFLVCFV